MCTDVMYEGLLGQLFCQFQGVGGFSDGGEHGLGLLRRVIDLIFPIAIGMLIYLKVVKCFFKFVVCVVHEFNISLFDFSNMLIQSIFKTCVFACIGAIEPFEVVPVVVLEVFS